MQEPITGAEILMRALIDEGVDTLFGYPGGAIMPVYDALYDYTDRLRHVLVRHEQGAAHAAEGYARVSGRVGVCMVTSGPGATNTITGIADAMMDSTPIVVIMGQVGVPLLGSDAFQECDVVDVSMPVSKWSYQIRSAADVAWAVSRAFYIARSGRPGPVVLDFTKSAQIEKAVYEPQKIDFIRSYVPVPKTDRESIVQAANLINAAKRPLVLVGQGVELGNATEEVRAFIEKGGLPFGATLHGLSAVPSDHPLHVGMLGMHGSIGANKNTQECDLLIAIGMRFDDRITGKLSTYATQAKKIHFEIDPSEINKNVKVDVAVLGDCKDTVRAVSELIVPRTHDEWRASFLPYDRLEKEAVIEPQIHPAEGSLRMGEVVRRVSELTEHSAILCTDVGQNQMFAARYFKFTRPRSLATSGGMGTMGYGLPAAMGAAYASPDRTVCAFMGDGGFQMVVQELGTIMEYQIPVKMILLDNNYLGNVRQWQELFFKHRYSFTPMTNPDFLKIAEAYRIPARLVTDRNELDDSIREMLDTDGPFLLHVAVKEEDNIWPMVYPGQDIDNVVVCQTKDNIIKA
ncbi:biosynthetic-type acetolactate synthase large subunit [Alloprevotella sp. OH1205_COT-284]|uniref:biosynthetic-type acetolactate synthase large subunit n=1 Tax=Alloprevotella sp. OH1205_COT-284 TaxID=2491043 RepID=UPI000F5D55B0|nr:biosynthetic-type acetolactate synthase large subunit [Alloprevotella sp. OH1205_COT-284]RRD80214.1 biosynthetic-type acetolactate synthase large subunit [Alloprevotella sp. OH1205_COT-284]